MTQFVLFDKENYIRYDIISSQIERIPGLGVGAKFKIWAMKPKRRIKWVTGGRFRIGQLAT